MYVLQYVALLLWQVRMNKRKSIMEFFNFMLLDFKYVRMMLNKALVLLHVSIGI
jgi:hypothetical protein